MLPRAKTMLRRANYEGGDLVSSAGQIYDPRARFVDDRDEYMNEGKYPSISRCSSRYGMAHYRVLVDMTACGFLIATGGEYGIDDFYLLPSVGRIPVKAFIAAATDEIPTKEELQGMDDESAFTPSSVKR